MVKNILIFSNGPKLLFGYSIVFSEVADELAKQGYNVYYLDNQYFGKPYKYNGYTILGIKYSPWCSDCLEHYIRVLGIDTVITGIDTWMPFVSFLPEIFKNYPQVNWVCHLTVNSTPLSPLIESKFYSAEKLVCPSKFVYRVVAERGHKNIVYIPHCVNKDIFKPNLEERDKLRRYFNIEDKFVFIACMRNKDNQKNATTLMKSYKVACMENKEFNDNTRLYIICDPEEPDGVNLNTIRKMYKLDDNVVFPWIKFDEDMDTIPCLEGRQEGMPFCTSQSFSRKSMSNLYNMADCHVNSSSGESFGLPCLESMACGKPQIVNEATTGLELVKEPNTGIAVPHAYDLFLNSLTEIKLIDPIKLKEAFISMFNKENYEEYSKNALEFSNNYLSKDIRNEWVDLVKSLKDKRNINYNKGELGL